MVQLGLLFSIYSLPNIVSVFFGGVLADRIGTNKCIAICAGDRPQPAPATSTVPTHSRE